MDYSLIFYLMVKYFTLLSVFCPLAVQKRFFGAKKTLSASKFDTPLLQASVCHAHIFLLKYNTRYGTL